MSKPANIWLEKPGGRVKVARLRTGPGHRRGHAPDDDCGHPGTPSPIWLPNKRAVTSSTTAPICSAWESCFTDFSRGGAAVRRATLQWPSHRSGNGGPRPIQELVPDVPPALANLIMRLLAKDPSQRPATAKEVVHKIQAIEREPASPPPKRAPPRTDVRRRTQLAPTVAVVFAAVGLLAWFFGPTLLQVIEGRGELGRRCGGSRRRRCRRAPRHSRPGRQAAIGGRLGRRWRRRSAPTAHGGTLLTEKFTLKRGSSYMVHVKREAVARRSAGQGESIADPRRQGRAVCRRPCGRQDRIQNFRRSLGTKERRRSH